LLIIGVIKGMLDGIIDEIGDISGWTALDMGSGPCTMVACLANRIGDGRVFAVDLYMGLMDTLKKVLSEDLLLRTVVVKADLRRLDFLKNDFVDLVTAYDTLSVVEEYTPGGTPYVLNEARRILKPDGWFVAVEHWPLESIKPVDKAQEAEVRWWKIHMDIWEALGETVGVEYTPDTLQRTLRKAGFVISHWKRAESDKTEPGIKFGPKIIEKVEKIPDERLRKRIFREMQSIEKDALKYGMKELPHFVVYAKNPKRKRFKKLRKLPLKELYRTVYHKDLLS
jgi:ubiquinone/menaquinone biosynthesis C-methylase UbiE